MCNEACIQFGVTQLLPADIRGKTVLEVGARDVNGSLRGHVQSLEPASYVGVDIEFGPGVDELCRGEQLVQRYGAESFDVVLASEMLEHVRDWRTVVSNLKRVVKPNGILLFTTRSPGFKFHGYPFDFWRYELSDIPVLFCDFAIEVLLTDPSAPGVFFKGRKPVDFKEQNLAGYPLYSMITERRTPQVREYEIFAFHVRYLARAIAAGVPVRIRRATLPEPVRLRIRRLLGL